MWKSENTASEKLGNFLRTLFTQCFTSVRRQLFTGVFEYRLRLLNQTSMNWKIRLRWGDLWKRGYWSRSPVSFFSEPSSGQFSARVHWFQCASRDLILWGAFLSGAAKCNATSNIRKIYSFSACNILSPFSTHLFSSGIYKKVLNIHKDSLEQRNSFSFSRVTNPMEVLKIRFLAYLPAFEILRFANFPLIPRPGLEAVTSLHEL